MQDRYAGDVGDFGKLALLRALAPGRRLRVCWYRCSGAGETNDDGRHVDYLESGVEGPVSESGRLCRGDAHQARGHRGWRVLMLAILLSSP